jgi:hypothetical protein
MFFKRSYLPNRNSKNAGDLDLEIIAIKEAALIVIKIEHHSLSKFSSSKNGQQLRLLKMTFMKV